MHHFKIGASVLCGLVWLISLVANLPPFPYWVLVPVGLAFIIPWRGVLFMLLYFLGVHTSKLRNKLEPLAKRWPAFKVFLHPKPHRTATQKPTLRLLFLNAYTFNRDVSRQIDFLLQQNADVVALCEANATFQAQFSALKTLYPYHYAVPVSDSLLGYSMAILSKVPIKHLQTEANGRLVHYEIYHPNGTFHFAHIHPHAPFTPWRVSRRNAITSLIQNVKSPYPIVVGGDFNNVPWNVAVRGVCEAHNLQIASPPVPTFPVEQRLGKWSLKLKPIAPFDFVLLPKAARVKQAFALKAPLTDHMAYVVDFHF